MSSEPLVTNPITIFFIVLAIIVLAPVLLNRLRIPPIVGMIAAGVIVGPYGFNILADDSSFVIFGQVGLLYLMFLAGIEIDMYHLQLNFKKGLLFGLLTFLIPLALGIVVSRTLLGLDMLTAFLLGSMFAAHTLISYPVAARYGVTKTTAVLIAVVGTIITVVGSLLVLAGVVNITNTGEFDLLLFAWLIVKMTIYAISVIFLYPLITRWFLRRYSDRVTQFVFILSLVFLSAWIAELIGLSGVLGAFFGGLILNRYVPAASSLMSRIEFVGNAIFIPYFLIGVGMMVNVKVIIDPDTLTTAAIMLFVALVSKWGAARLSGLFYRMHRADSLIMFGLTTAHTAVALAVVTIGYVTFLPNGERMLDSRIMNATIVVILITCALAPIITASAASKIRLRILESDVNEEVSEPSKEYIPKTLRVLVPVSNPVTAPGLMELALLLLGKRSGGNSYQVTLLNVRNDNSSKSKTIGRTCLELAAQVAASAEVNTTQIERYDINTVTGINNVIEERDINCVVLGMHHKTTIVDTFMGSKLEQLLIKNHRQIVISRCYAPLNTLSRMIVYVPPRAQLEIGFHQWVRLTGNLGTELGCTVQYCAPAEVNESIETCLSNWGYKFRTEYKIVENGDDFVMMANMIEEEDLFLWITARQGSVSWDNEQKELPSFMSHHLQRNNLIVIYPEIRNEIVGELHSQFVSL